MPTTVTDEASSFAMTYEAASIPMKDDPMMTTRGLDAGVVRPRIVSQMPVLWLRSRMGKMFFTVSAPGRRRAGPPVAQRTLK
jgi:hypothetical protein